jgi:hypothetical protein
MMVVVARKECRGKSAECIELVGVLMCQVKIPHYVESGPRVMSSYKGSGSGESPRFLFYNG